MVNSEVVILYKLHTVINSDGQYISIYLVCCNSMCVPTCQVEFDLLRTP